MKRYIRKHGFELLMVVTLVATLAMVAMEPATETTYAQHTVQTGETVWEIAGQYAGQQVKPFNEFVYQIQADNKLAGRYIQPGDTLVIPMESSIDNK